MVCQSRCTRQTLSFTKASNKYYLTTLSGYFICRFIFIYYYYHTRGDIIMNFYFETVWYTC